PRLDVRQCGGLVVRRHHEARCPREELLDSGPLGRYGQLEKAVTCDTFLVDGWMATHDVERRIRLVRADGSERTQDTRAVLPFPVGADEQEARGRPVPIRARPDDVVLSHADDVHLAVVDSVARDGRVRGPAGREAATDGVLVRALL